MKEDWTIALFGGVAGAVGYGAFDVLFRLFS
jgi:hypothetical protein